MGERYGHDFSAEQYEAAGVDPEEAAYWQKRASDGNDTNYDLAQQQVDSLDLAVLNEQTRQDSVFTD